MQFTRGAEFKFSQSSIQVRETFLTTINPLQFTVRALIVDKEALTQSQLRDKERFYNDFVRLVLDHNFDAIRDATLVLDESFKGRRAKEDLRTSLRRRLNTARESPTLTKILYHRSHTDYLLQVSDMVCGAIYAAYNKNEPRYRQLIRRHIADEWSLRPHERAKDGPLI